MNNILAPDDVVLAEMLALAEMFADQACCRHCGCSEHDACPDDGSGQPCHWIVPPSPEDPAGGVCSHPSCLATLCAENTARLLLAGQEVEL